MPYLQTHTTRDLLWQLIKQYGKERILTEKDFLITKLSKNYVPSMKLDCQLLDAAMTCGIGQELCRYSEEDMPAPAELAVLVDRLTSVGMTEDQAVYTLQLFFSSLGWGEPKFQQPKSVDAYPSQYRDIADLLRMLCDQYGPDKLLMDSAFFLEQLAKNYHPSLKTDCILMERAFSTGILALLHTRWSASPTADVTQDEYRSFELELTENGLSTHETSLFLLHMFTMLEWKMAAPAPVRMKGFLLFVGVLCVLIALVAVGINLKINCTAKPTELITEQSSVSGLQKSNEQIATVFLSTLMEALPE